MNQESTERLVDLIVGAAAEAAERGGPDAVKEFAPELQPETILDLLESPDEGPRRLELKIKMLAMMEQRAGVPFELSRAKACSDILNRRSAEAVCEAIVKLSNIIDKDPQIQGNYSESFDPLYDVCSHYCHVYQRNVLNKEKKHA